MLKFFTLKSAPFYKLFAGLGSTNKPTTFLLLSDSHSVLTTLSSSLSFLLFQSSWHIWQELSSLSCTNRLQWVSRRSFLTGNNVADELARWGALLLSSVIPCSLALIFHIHSSLYSDWSCTVSKFFDTQVSSISTKELVLPYHACCALSLTFAAMDTAYYLALISLELAELRILFFLCIRICSKNVHKLNDFIAD